LYLHHNKLLNVIIRAAAVGQEGVDKRIDVLSMAMQNNMTVDELTASFQPFYN
jgi:CoA-disulfide reductase